MLDAVAVTASGICGAAIGAAWPFAASRFLEWKYAQSCAKWRSGLEDLKKWMAEHPGKTPSKKASGDEGVAGVWLDAQFPRKQWGYMTVEEHELLSACGVGIEECPGTLTTDEDRRKNGFELKASLPLAGGLAAAGCALGAGLGMVGGWAAFLQLLLIAVFGVCAYTDGKCRHTSWQLWIVLDAVAVAYRAVFFGLEGLAEGAVVTLCVVAVFLATHGVCLLINRAKAKAASAAVRKAPVAAVPPVGFGDYMLIVPICMACGIVGSIFGLAVAFGSILVATVVGMFRYRVNAATTFPMAPYLLIGLIIGLAVPFVRL